MNSVLRSFGLAWTALTIGCGASGAEDWVFRHENVLGTSLELRVAACDEAAAMRAEGAVLAEIDRLDGVFSTYRPESELARWLRSSGSPRPISGELFDVISASERWQTASGGAFNPLAQVATQLWQRCEREAREPSSDELAAAVHAMSLPAYRLDKRTKSAVRLGDAPLSLNAIAKGRIVDRCCEVALEETRGVTGVLVAIGGDERAAGELARDVEIVDPRHPAENSRPLAVVRLNGKALSTSGGYRRGVSVGGTWRSHIIDPRTARPTGNVLGASVLAPRAIDADALATIACVLEPRETLQLVSQTEGAECLILDRQGKQHSSPGWTLAALQSPDVSAAKTGGEFELHVGFEINDPAAARYHRPYVAVWIENAEGFPVRTLLLWVKTSGSGPTWVPDLKRWYRGDLKRVETDRRDFVATRSGATRPPGKYEVVWDGKDDSGVAVKPGEYTLGIEAAREHGTYKVIRKKFAHGGEAFGEKLEGNVEIKSATITYRRRSP